MSLAIESIETNKVKLDSLEIRGFRAFEHLRIEKLGRVNLITGKNNVGKTSLLDALWLYAYQGSLDVIWQILEARDERKRPQITNPDDEDELPALVRSTLKNYKLNQSQLPSLKYIFHGRRDIRKKTEPVQIGSINFQNESLSIGIGYWYLEKSAIGNEQRRRYKPLEFEQREKIDDAFLALWIRSGRKIESVYRLDEPPFAMFRGKEPMFKCLFVFSDGLSDSEIADMWDGIVFTSLEDKVIDALKIIAPEIERMNFIGSQTSGEELERIPVVKMQGFDEPLPLRSLGEGMNRLLGIALALVNAKDGMLLIDEVESGLHYSVQPDVWRLIFETARRLNVQVFATTHSWDCIEAFQNAVQDSGEEEGYLIRLENKRNQIISTLFDKRRLDIATREHIEVR
jgi:hypothetical protein